MGIYKTEVFQKCIGLKKLMNGKGLFLNSRRYGHNRFFLNLKDFKCPWLKFEKIEKNGFPVLPPSLGAKPESRKSV
jgi:hypothetical protein